MTHDRGTAERARLHDTSENARTKASRKSARQWRSIPLLDRCTLELILRSQQPRFTHEPGGLHPLD